MTFWHKQNENPRSSPKIVFEALFDLIFRHNINHINGATHIHLTNKKYENNNNSDKGIISYSMFDSCSRQTPSLWIFYACKYMHISRQLVYTLP